MQLLLKFTSNEDLIFDDNNIRVMQGFIYKKLSAIGADYIHDESYQYNNKVFRHFCFSDIVSRYDLNKGLKNYHKDFLFYFSTSLDFLIPDFCEALYQEAIIYGHRELRCQSILIVDSSVNEEQIYIESKSPIVAEKTLFLEDGKKTRVSFSPFDTDFLQIIKSNLIAKHNSLYEDIIDDCDFFIDEITEYRLVEKKYVKANSRGGNIKGYSIKCRLSGDKRLLKIALNSGLGARNAQGFGFIRKINKR